MIRLPKTVKITRLNPVQYCLNNFGLTQIALNPHVPSNAENSFKAIGEKIMPFTFPRLFDSHGFFGGTKVQQVENLKRQNRELLKYFFAYHQEKKALFNSENQELVTKVSAVEFSNHPSRRDGAFNEEMTEEIFRDIIDIFKTLPKDNNFMFTTTLPTVSKIHVTENEKIIAEQNAFLTLGYGLHLDFSSVNHRRNDEVGVIVHAKVNPFVSDVSYQDKFSTLPFNPFVFLLKTNDGNYVLCVHEICLDHRNSQGIKAFENWLTTVAKNFPSIYLILLELPIIQDILSSSVEINPHNLLSNTVMHTNREIRQNEIDSYEHAQGVKQYKLGSSGQLELVTEYGTSERENLTVGSRNAKITKNAIIEMPQQNEKAREIIKKIGSEHSIAGLDKPEDISEKNQTGYQTITPRK